MPKNTGNQFSVSQPQLNSSDRTAHLKSKTKYAAATNLAQNGGILTKRNGANYVGPVRTTCSSLSSAASYTDLLDVTKGKYLLTPPPSSKLDESFSPQNGEVYYGNFTVTNYTNANVPVTVLGFPTINSSNQYIYPNKLVAATPPATVATFKNSNIVVDPEYRMFYRKGTCNIRNYFKNVYLDPNLDVTWETSTGQLLSNKPYNQQQAQRIIANQAQSLRGFQYPTRVHFDFDNCESKASISPVAPDAPVIYLSSYSGPDIDGLYDVTITWLHGFDGGSPIKYYTVSINHKQNVHTVLPNPCSNTYTAKIPCGQKIWVSATNCVPKETYPANATEEQRCTELTSHKSNKVMIKCPNPGELPVPEVIIANHSEESGPETGGVGLLIGFPAQYTAVNSMTVANGATTYTFPMPLQSGYYVFYENNYSSGFWPNLTGQNVLQVQHNSGLCGGVVFGASLTFRYNLSTAPGVYHTVVYTPPEPQLDITDGYQYQQYNEYYPVPGPFSWDQSWGIQTGASAPQSYQDWSGTGIYKHLYPNSS